MLQKSERFDSINCIVVDLNYCNLILNVECLVIFLFFLMWLSLFFLYTLPVAFTDVFLFLFILFVFYKMIQYEFFVGRRSRNKVFVGEPAKGSFRRCCLTHVLHDAVAP